MKNIVTLLLLFAFFKPTIVSAGDDQPGFCINPSISAFNASSMSICTGESVTLTITGNLNDADFWRLYSTGCGSGPVGPGQTSKVFTVSPTTTTTYFVRGEGTCILPQPCNQLTITVNPSFEDNLTDTVCNGASYTFPDGSSMDNISAAVTDTSTFVAANLCDSLVIVELSVITLDTSVTNDGTTLTASEPGALYQWVDCDNGNNPIAGESNISFTPSQTGNYAVMIDKNPCLAMSNCHFVEVLPTGLGDSNWKELVSIAPNPMLDQLTVQLGGQLLSGTVDVVNTLGQVVLSDAFQEATAVELNTSALASGVYVVYIRSQGQSAGWKIVKE